MTYQKSYWISIAGLAVGLVLLALAAAFESDVLGWIGGIAAILSQLQTFSFHCCPVAKHTSSPRFPLTVIAHAAGSRWNKYESVMSIHKEDNTNEIRSRVL